MTVHLEGEAGGALAYPTTRSDKVQREVGLAVVRASVRHDQVTAQDRGDDLGPEVGGYTEFGIGDDARVALILERSSGGLDWRRCAREGDVVVPRPRP